MIKSFNIKLTILSVINIKLILLYIIFKGDIVDKKRFNLIDKIIPKSQYSNSSFYNSNFFFNFDVILRKINNNTLNL